MARQRTGLVRYATYSRCSNDDQAHKDFSTIDVQRALNEQYVQAKGGRLAGGYQDEGISGTTLARPGWKRMLADAQAGLFDAVVITYMSRLGRGDTCTVAEYLLKEAGVKVEMVKEQFTDDVAGYVNKTMTRFVDGMYVENVRQWTKTKMEAMVQAGYHCGGFPPFGYMKVTEPQAGSFHKPGKEPPKRLVPHPDEADIVRQAFALYAQSAKIATVRAYLNSVTLRRWTTTSVKNLLANEIFLGIQQFGQWRNETAHPPIVDAETWQLAQDALPTATGRHRDATPDHFVYYLRGRVFCPHCGCPFTYAGASGRSRKVHYYTCQRTNAKGVGCPVRRVNADRLHQTVLHYMDHAAKHKAVMLRLIGQSGGWGSADEELKTLRGQLGKQKQSLEMRIGNYIKALGDGRNSPALLAALTKAETEVALVSEQMELADQEIVKATVRRPIAEDVQEAWRRIIEVWAVLTEEERAELMGTVVQRVDILDNENAAIELLPIQLPHSARFKLTDDLGAGVGLEPTTSGL